MKSYTYIIQFLTGRQQTVFTVGLPNAVILGMAEEIKLGNDPRIESITVDYGTFKSKEIKTSMADYFSIKITNP